MVRSGSLCTASEPSERLVPPGLAGHQALELCNTLAGWGEERPREYLTDYRALVVWARERRLVDADAAATLVESRGRRPDGVLGRVRSFRAALYAVLTGAAGEAEWATLADEVEQAAAAARFEPHDGRARWALPVTVELPLEAAAAAAAGFLVAPERIGRCPGRDCGWLFVNPRGTRRWCSMAVCGNRAKVAGHALRTARRERGT